MLTLLLIRAIKLYQRFGSPSRLARCRFFPSCSNYALEAIERFGALRGGVLTLFRLLRCHPFCKGGYDPVPERADKKQRKNHHGGRFS